MGVFKLTKPDHHTNGFDEAVTQAIDYWQAKRADQWSGSAVARDTIAATETDIWLSAMIAEPLRREDGIAFVHHAGTVAIVSDVVIDGEIVDTFGWRISIAYNGDDRDLPWQRGWYRLRVQRGDQCLRLARFTRMDCGEAKTLAYLAASGIRNNPRQSLVELVAQVDEQAADYGADAG